MTELVENVEQEQGAVEQAEALEQQVEQRAPDPFEDFARERGWSPKEEWRGKPEDWREPKDFIAYGMERGRDATREVRELKSTVDRIGRVSETVMRREIENARREAEERFAGAVEAKDHEGARAAREELARLDQPSEANAPAPAINDFMQRNGGWYGQNRAATALAQSITAEAAARGITPDEQLRMAEDAVRSDFPQLFHGQRQPAKPAPAVSAPETRAAQTRPAAKTFATLPAEAQRAGSDFLKRGMVKTLEDYAKVYYEEQTA
jgi:hypothetical protein